MSNEYKIDVVGKDELPEILKLQYLAYQSEAALFGGKKIPPLAQTLDEVAKEYEEGIILVWSWIHHYACMRLRLRSISCFFNT